MGKITKKIMDRFTLRDSQPFLCDFHRVLRAIHRTGDFSHLSTLIPGDTKPNKSLIRGSADFVPNRCTCSVYGNLKSLREKNDKKKLRRRSPGSTGDDSQGDKTK